MLNNIPHVTPDIWRNLFSPASVAVIGASNKLGSWGNDALKGVLSNGERRVYPVNPNSTDVLGIKSYPSVMDIPDTIDLAVIVIGEKLVAGVLRQCIAKGIKAVVIITSGFAETGEAGRKLETELVEIARQGGVRFIGPNSMGHADTGSPLSTFGRTEKMRRGPVAVLSQSGSTCIKIMRSLAEVGVDCSKYVSTGNEASICMEDYLEYLGEDDSTRIIVAYIEGLRDGRRFFQLASKITPRKPIVVVKIGGTEQSARAVMSHTGALAGTDAVYTAAFRQSGVIRAEDDEELCDIVYSLVNSPLPRSNRVGILSVGGGQGALTAEVCEKEGLVIGELEPGTVKKLDEFLPPRWPRRNPIDMAGPSAEELSEIGSLLRPIIEDKNLDIIFLQVPIIMNKGLLSRYVGLEPEQVLAYRKKEEENIMLIGENVEKYQKPVALMWQGSGVNTDPAVTALFRKGKILAFTSARRSARVMRHLVWYKQYCDAVSGK